jgi:hypothetical protein
MSSKSVVVSQLYINLDNLPGTVFFTYQGSKLSEQRAITNKVNIEKNIEGILIPHIL